MVTHFSNLLKKYMNFSKPSKVAKNWHHFHLSSNMRKSNFSSFKQSSNRERLKACMEE